MKKSFILTLLMSIILFCSCTGCSSNKEEKKQLTDSVPTVEQMIVADTDSMQAKGNRFVWYETLILLNNYLDEENDGSFSEVVNVFQAIVNEHEKSFDTRVYKFQHFTDGTFATDSVAGFWIEDYPLVDSLIKVPYDSAYALMTRVNLPKPHSRHVCLRNPIGPKECNPQWVFGNIEEQIWIDATTGEAKNSNPAFPDNFKYAFTW